MRVGIRRKASIYVSNITVKVQRGTQGLREDPTSYFPPHLENVSRDIVQNGHDVLHQVELRLIPKHILHAHREEDRPVQTHPTCTQGGR